MCVSCQIFDKIKKMNIYVWDERQKVDIDEFHKNKHAMQTYEKLLDVSVRRTFLATGQQWLLEH